MQHNRWLLALRERLKNTRPSRIAIYGAGSHTKKHISTLKEWCSYYNHELKAILDDSPSLPEIEGITVGKADDFDSSALDLVIISSDSFESSIWSRALEVFKDSGVEIWRIYSSYPELDPSGLIPATRQPGGKEKIAVVDMIFNWPPDGGARKDLYEICARLARKAHVRLFVPSLCDGGLIRGSVSQSLPFEVQLIPCEPKEFRAGIIDQRLLDMVQHFKANQVLIGDAYHLKPVLVNTFAEYKPIVRFYAYETMCLKGSGELYRNGKACKSSWAASNNKKAWMECLSCSMDFYVAAGGCRFFRDEALGSGALDSSYPELVADAYQKASALICYNNTMAKLLERFNDNVRVVPSGVDTEVFRPEPEKTRAENTFLMSGRICDERKGFLWLRDACDMLAEKGLRFTLATTGTMMNTTRSYHHNVGWIESDKSLAKILSGSSVCIAPSLWPEAFGIVALEAMACGIPVIASKTGGLGEIFTDGKEGFYVEPGDIKGLAETMNRFIAHPELKKQMGAHGRKLVCDNYQWDNIAETYIYPLFNLPSPEKR